MSRKRRERASSKGVEPGRGQATALRADALKPYFWLVIPLSWILILVVLEGGLRLIGFGHSAALFESVDGELLVDNPNYTRRFYAVGDRFEPVQRSNLFPTEKPAGQLRVFVVGGSTAQGFPYQRNHGFGAIAEAALRAIDVDVEVLNVGNAAMSSYYVREALRDIRRYDPDLMVVYAGHNEYYGTPSSFTGGTHWSRVAALRLRKYRVVQGLEGLLSPLLGRGETDTTTLMERRFAEILFPPDSARDRKVGELFVRNVASGLGPLLRAGVPAVVYEPASNLTGMAPFRGPAVGDPTGAPAGAGAAADPVGGYRTLVADFDGEAWDREAWASVKDMDHAPFRARSTLVEMAQAYAASEPAVRWIPTSAELEGRRGSAGLGDALFIDHLHFNFEGQMYLAAMLAHVVVEGFYMGDRMLRVELEAYFADQDRVRADIHLTDFWEFEAYTRIASLQAREPFASMPIPRAQPAIPERVTRNSLFRTRDFIEALREAGTEEMFYLALDRYRMIDRDEWIRNMNAYIHLFPGHHQSHLAYGVALLEDQGRGAIDQAGMYIERAYALSGRDPEVVETAREALFRTGMGAAWGPFQARYLE